MAIVAAHRDVNGVVYRYCVDHGMEIAEHYNGDLKEYQGRCRIVVTGEHMDKYEFYTMKMLMLRNRVELISVEWDSTELDEFVEYLTVHDGKSTSIPRHGRLPFGFQWRDGQMVEIPDAIAVARRIIELRDQGWKYRQIMGDPNVRHVDGRRMSQSTIQVILKNRDRYVKG